MVSAISSASTAVTTTSALSSSDSNSKAAALKAELADKQSQLAQAKTDDEKAELNAEIEELNAEISAAQVTGNSASSSSSAAASAKTQKAADASHKGHFNTADKAAPESRMSSANMDVLMRMGQRGGMGGPQNISKMYSDMDGDNDGTVTKDEFVSANAERMGKDQAGKVFDSIDTEGTGSITEDQFAENVKSHDHRDGGPRMGPQDGGRPAWNDQSSTAAADDSAVMVA